MDQPGVAGHWWTIALRGGVSVLFGLAALLRPEIALGALILLFGAYALVDGAFSLAGVFSSSRNGTGRLMLTIQGIIGVVIGLLTFLVPGVTALTLLYLIAVWLIVGGVSQVLLAIELRKEIRDEFAMIAGGVLSVVVGIIFAILPWVGVLSLVWLLGLYALIFGVFLVILGFRLRSHQSNNTPSRVA